MAAGGAGEMEEEESAEDLSTVVKDWMKQNYIKVNIIAIDIITIVTTTSSLSLSLDKTELYEGRN